VASRAYTLGQDWGEKVTGVQFFISVFVMKKKIPAPNSKKPKNP